MKFVLALLLFWHQLHRDVQVSIVAAGSDRVLAFDKTFFVGSSNQWKYW